MAERVTIIDYGSGNLRSVERAFERAARESGAAIVLRVTSNPDEVANADRIVLPGVGAFAACKAGLIALPGMLEALERAVLIEKRPFLGVCVGMQLLAERSTEFGETRGLGWIAGEVRRIDVDAAGLRTPHMGWDNVRVRVEHPVLHAAAHNEDFYFAHSYHFEVENDHERIAVCTYGSALTAAVARDNILGVQFHPEKSQAAGVELLSAFLRWTPQ